MPGNGRSTSYRPELDGIRAVAILAVMVVHTQLFWFTKLKTDGLARGVDLFFVLSGFLITSLLVGEHEATGRIRRGRFYARRVLRLWPALWLCLALGAFVAVRVGGSDAATYPREVAIAMGFAGNWFQPTIPILAHTWSLGLEEQYYLVWPFVLTALLARRARKGPIAFGLLMAALGVTAMRAYFVHSYFGTAYPSGHEGWRVMTMFAWSRADGVLIGSALALLLASDYGEFLKDFLREKGLAFAAIVAAVAIVARSSFRNPTMYDSELLIDLCFALIVGHVVANDRSPVSRVLRTGPLASIGRISYGLYLFHYPLFVLLSKTVHSNAEAAAIAWGASFVAASGSFLLVELPILGLKKRLGTRAPIESLQPSVTGHPQRDVVRRRPRPARERVTAQAA